MDWTCEAISRNTHVIRIPFDERKDWRSRVLLTSDRHWDHPDSDLDLQKKHLDEALEIGAPVVDIGDLFCVMQAKNDKRGSKAKIRPEHQTDTYFDSVVETAVEWFMPYKDIITVIAAGNHDTSVKRHQEIDILRRFCSELGCHQGGYRGFVRFQFESNVSAMRHSLVMYYTHGSGGNSPVTKGTIRTNRRNASVDGVDIIVSGHIHNAWVMETPVHYLNQANRIAERNRIHIQIPTYKRGLGDLAEGWENEKEFPPSPVGGWWLEFRFDYKTKSIKFKPIRTDN